jgi:GH43 family beta-xylosidase
MRWCALVPLLLATLGAMAAPLVPPRYTDMEHPDPFVTRVGDTWYGTHTTMYNGVYTEWIFLYKGTDLETLFAPENRRLVWQAPKLGWNTRDLWAPELHRIEGVWYLYYSANGRSGVLSNPQDDPTVGAWTEAGRLFVEGADDWSIDGTVLNQGGRWYFLWSGITPDQPGVQRLFISAMASPTRLTGPRVQLSQPDHDWENQGSAGVFHVNEGPAVLHHGERTFVTYSASFCMTAAYCLGLLWCDKTANPMEQDSWHKSDRPVFASNPDQDLWGPGHNSFTTDARGRDVIVYHAMESPKGFARRELFFQPFDWDGNGFPVLGVPVRYPPVRP